MMTYTDVAPRNTMNSITGYRRNSDGTLELIEIPMVDGVPHGLTKTDETTQLLGWAFDDCRIWRTDGGVEIYLPCWL